MNLHIPAPKGAKQWFWTITLAPIMIPILMLLLAYWGVAILNQRIGALATLLLLTGAVVIGSAIASGN